MSENETSLAWSDEALERLGRVPSFLRRMVRKRVEALVVERGETLVTAAHLAELGRRRPGAAMPSAPSERPTESASGVAALPWTAAALERLEDWPSFFRPELQTMAEEAARVDGHLEVNLALLDRLESEQEFRRRLPWTREAECALARALAEHPELVRSFVGPAMEEATERITKAQHRDTVAPEDVGRAFDTRGAGVAWSPEALARVESAPEFVRGGIKKAAEAAARREGLPRIEPDDLTRFRNRAMMRAVKRMRAFGYRELTFDAFETARERVPRLRENPQAERRFAAIRDHVEGKGGLGVIDTDLLERMKKFLRDDDERGDS